MPSRNGRADSKFAFQINVDQKFKKKKKPFNIQSFKIRTMIIQIKIIQKKIATPHRTLTKKNWRLCDEM